MVRCEAGRLVTVAWAINRRRFPPPTQRLNAHDSLRAVPSQHSWADFRIGSLRMRLTAKDLLSASQKHLT